MKKIVTAWLIDDDQVYTYIATRLMRALSFSETVLAFDNGEEAIRKLRDMLESPERLPSVIFLDIHMPLMNGWQFLDRFRLLQIPKKVTIYMVSSSLNNSDWVKAASYNEVAHFYVKPITKENLLEILNNQ